MKKRIGILCLLLSNYMFGVTVDYAVEVKSYFADIKVEIVDYFGDEKWEIVGACSNQPSVSVEIVDYFGDKKIEIVDYFGDKKICITNPKDLDRKTLKKLKIIKD